MKIKIVVFCVFIIFGINAQERLKYKNPDLIVDLGVGLWAWPMPMDWDGDGDFDLVVSCPDTPYNGTYFFENPSGNKKYPVFKPGKKVGPGIMNVQLSWVDGKPRVLAPGKEYVDFIGSGFYKTRIISIPDLGLKGRRIRAKQWKYVDFNGDEKIDLCIGIGDWTDYGWDNAFDSQGNWTRGPLHGYVFILLNKGTNNKPVYDKPFRLKAQGKPIDVFGRPSPCFADFDGDGDLDLICGEFLDSFKYFKNIGTRNNPQYAEGVYLKNNGKKISMYLQMITPTAIDWDRDGDIDIISGDEDGRVAFIENTGKLINGIPLFKQPVYFKQIADDLKFGALATPFSVDWDGDGDEDLICGNTAGNIGFIENLDGGDPPKWGAPRLLKADGKIIRIMAGRNGSIQGPCEAKWGYTVPVVVDWDGDGLLDIIVNSIWGKIIWFKNIGTRNKPKLSKQKAVKVLWKKKPLKPKWVWWNPKRYEFVTQWRTTPFATFWDKDDLCDIIMLDHEGYLAFFKRTKTEKGVFLLPGKRIFLGSHFDSKHRIIKRFTDAKKTHLLLRLNSMSAGKSGRRKFTLVDWDLDGDIDIIVNSANVSFLENKGTYNGKILFGDKGNLFKMKLAGHTTSPTIVNWDKDKKPDLVIGAEGGHFYYFKNPNKENGK